MNQDELNERTERMGNLYDSIEKAIATWSDEQKENILQHMVCLWAIAAKAEDAGGIRHPLVQDINDIFRSYGLKTAAEIAKLKKELEN